MLSDGRSSFGLVCLKTWGRGREFATYSIIEDEYNSGHIKIQRERESKWFPFYSCTYVVFRLIVVYGRKDVTIAIVHYTTRTECRLQNSNALPSRALFNRKWRNDRKRKCRPSQDLLLLWARSNNGIGHDDDDDDDDASDKGHGRGWCVLQDSQNVE